MKYTKHDWLGANSDLVPSEKTKTLHILGRIDIAKDFQKAQMTRDMHRNTLGSSKA